MLKFALVTVLLGLSVTAFAHEYRGIHRRKQEQAKHFYQHIESQQEKNPAEELEAPHDFQNVIPEFSANDVQQLPNDLLRFRSKVDRSSKEYDGSKSKRHWRCKHRGDTGTKVFHSSKYGYSRRYWKCKYRTNMTHTPDSSSSESQEYEPESLIGDIMDTIANP